MGIIVLVWLTEKAHVHMASMHSTVCAPAVRVHIAVPLVCSLLCCVFCCSFFGVMPAYSSQDSSLGAKLVSFYPTNETKGTATHHAIIMLLRPQTGVPLAVSGAEVKQHSRVCVVM